MSGEGLNQATVLTAGEGLTLVRYVGALLNRSGVITRPRKLGLALLGGSLGLRTP